jgi:hypothetical protein
MPFEKLKSLDSEIRSLDAETLDVKVAENSEQEREIKEMKKEGISLEEVKTSD